jgi:hypothetical protein
MFLKKPLVLITLLLNLFMFLGCSEKTTTTEYSLDYVDFDYISNYYEVFNRREGTYIVYVYSQSCVVCTELKADFLAFADSYTAYNVYFFDAGSVDTTYQADYLSSIGQSNVKTPTLLIIKNGTFDKTAVSRYYFEGESRIRSIMLDLKNNVYPYWN